MLIFLKKTRIIIYVCFFLFLIVYICINNFFLELNIYNICVVFI